MKTIELVVHCFAEKRPVFASMLTAQLSSLVLWEPRDCKVSVTVITTPTDSLTLRVVESLRSLVACCTLTLDKASVFRRAIGRNIAAKVSNADYLWMIDADYLLCSGCLDTLAASDFTGLAYPKQAMIHRSHSIGDAEIKRIIPGSIFSPDFSNFVPWRSKFAIGGLQIVDGDTARRGGYLDGTRWCNPSNAADFQDTREDRIFRGLFDKSTALDLPNLMRLRHSESAFEPSEKRLSQTGK